MKRNLHIMVFLLLFSVMLNAQSLVTEDFSSGIVPPDGWTIDAHAANWSSSATRNAGGTSPEAKFFYSPSFNAASRLISPVINTTGYTSLTLSFRHFLDDYSGTAYALGVATRAAGGPWTDVWTVSPTGDIGPELKVIEITSNDVGSASFEFCIYFNGNSYNLDNWYLDDIELSASVERDLGLAVIDMPRFSTGENLPVKGTVIDMGLEPIISFSLNYQVDNGDTVTETAVGFNMSLGDTWDFTLAEGLNLEPGDYMLKMWLSDVNGLGPDQRPGNDTSMIDLHVASQSVDRKPLFEEFTSSTCGPCATFNGTVFNSFIADHESELTLVKYQMDWPGNGDPYYTEEGGVRRAYYGVSYVPDLYTDGSQTATNSSGVNTALTNSLATPAFMDLSAYHVIDGTTVTVHLDINSHIGGEVIAYIAVFENVTTQNTGGNGETEFHHVMMKMLPDANGSVVMLADGATVSLDYSTDMSTTFVEEMDDLGVAVFVQEASSRMLFQSAYSRQSFVGIDEGKAQESIVVYPNPSKGMIHFNRMIEKADVTVCSVYGQEVARIDGFSGNVLDLTDLPAGNYILQLNGPSVREIKAVSIIR